MLVSPIMVVLDQPLIYPKVESGVFVHFDLVVLVGAYGCDA